MKRPDVLRGQTVRRRLSCGTLYVTVNHAEDGAAREIFCHLGKPGACQSALLDALARVVSLALAGGISGADVRRVLVGITCVDAPPGEPGRRPGSCVDVVAQLLEVEK